ncbi:Enhancing lycopene biosynthesis protein 2 [Shewanella sp. P1-14-1]|uniref:isoprenoid biosynthesis glyoxalase ElbB n=1 Tax=Shewanella sp. P1-14-1 TaxID=1723761 RepID=UPI0006D65C34|nr:isoprenoid biosynthesis glyoxalase ElbB [Shewanella sp. P1-14-1]KPZ68610.1 Enhancing lycopene biosynthesis protein 2 [Shewanella sp. P1-14-1]
MKNIAVLLSGCGVYDGAEIHESVLTLLALSKAGTNYQCFAPDVEQMHVVNHLNGEINGAETRNVLQESARICRGEVLNVQSLDITEYDGLIVPGGFGAAKNLCDFAVAGSGSTVEPSVEAFIQEFALVKKPIGFMCIAPVMIPSIFKTNPIGTIGNDSGTAQAFTEMGGEHRDATVEDIIVDTHNNIVSTPAYMLANSIAEANVGIEKLVAKVLEMT